MDGNEEPQLADLLLIEAPTNNSPLSQVEFKNCEFVSNSAQNGAGAVSLGDGAIGLFNKVVFEKNSAGEHVNRVAVHAVLVAGGWVWCVGAATPPRPSLPPAAKESASKALQGPAALALTSIWLLAHLCSPAYGAGGAVYLTSNAGFTEVSFQSNSAPSGGAVGVGQSSSGIYFNGCTFNVSCTPPSLAACQSVSREC